MSTSVDATPSRIFDRSIWLLSVMGILVLVLAIIAATRPSAGAAAAEPTVLDLELHEFAIHGGLAAEPGPVTLQVANSGTMIHNLALEGGPATADLDPGEQATLQLGTLEAGTYTVFCNIAGHRDAGMEAELVVGQGGGGHEQEMTPAEMDQMMIDSMKAFPVETVGHGNQPLEPTIAADGAKEFELVAAVTPWEVAPGQVVDAWTYNGTAPGPLLRVQVGDLVRVKVTNNTELSTDVHFHGVSLPNAMDGVSPLTQDPIVPGGTFTYEFEAEKPTIAMYHAHLHSQVSVPNGMLGAFIIDPVPMPLGTTVAGVDIPADLEVAQEIPMVLNDAGVIGFSLNGKSFPATEPYVANVGDWIVVHYFNEGLQIHPMHPHQFPQLVYAKDGIPLDHPYWSDTLAIAPGERYSVLMHLDRPGVWVWHCHILNHVEKETGMFGMVTAMIVQEP
jgi:FtsP/CotA-like multicopper oxidase with cupredoxin domain